MALIETAAVGGNGRKITVTAFYVRLGDKFSQLLATAEHLTTLGDYTLRAELMKIDSGEYVGLDNQSLRKGIVDVGMFSDDEITAIFADASSDEMPERFK